MRPQACPGPVRCEYKNLWGMKWSIVLLVVLPIADNWMLTKLILRNHNTHTTLSIICNNFDSLCSTIKSPTENFLARCRISWFTSRALCSQIASKCVSNNFISESEIMTKQEKQVCQVSISFEVYL